MLKLEEIKPEIQKQPIENMIGHAQVPRLSLDAVTNAPSASTNAMSGGKSSTNDPHAPP